MHRRHLRQVGCLNLPVKPRRRQEEETEERRNRKPKTIQEQNRISPLRESPNRTSTQLVKGPEVNPKKTHPKENLRQKELSHRQGLQPDWQEKKKKKQKRTAFRAVSANSQGPREGQLRGRQFVGQKLAEQSPKTKRTF